MKLRAQTQVVKRSLSYIIVNHKIYNMYAEKAAEINLTEMSKKIWHSTLKHATIKFIQTFSIKTPKYGLKF